MMVDVDPDADTRELAARPEQAEDPTGWFEQLYTAAATGTAEIPWDRPTPGALLATWARARGHARPGERALVVGCALGRDAEFLNTLGYDVVAFDVSATAIATAKQRHLQSTVEYVTADLLDPPASWRDGFDLVAESLNVQALPGEVRRRAIAGTGPLVAPGGTLIVVGWAEVNDQPQADGPPWPLTRDEIAAFATGDLQEVTVRNVADEGTPPVVHRWLAEFHRPA